MNRKNKRGNVMDFLDLSGRLLRIVLFDAFTADVAAGKSI